MMHDKYNLTRPQNKALANKLLKEKIYLDKSEVKNEAMYYIFNADIEVVPAGTTVSAMSVEVNNAEYQRYAEEYDLKFIFDDNTPTVDFYAVPQLDIFATDSMGGLFATLGAVTGLDEITAPICYVSKDDNCFTVANNLKEFLRMIKAECEWRSAMKNTENITLYISKSEAEKDVDFWEMPKVVSGDSL